MILAGVYLGQRLRDIASLTWINVDMEKKAIRLVTSKTSRTQIIPLAQPLFNYLSELKAGDDRKTPLFPYAYEVATKKDDLSSLSQQFYEVLVSAGLAPARSPKSEGSGIGRSSPRVRSEISFHSLRHTATSLLKNAGVSETITRDIIGHDSAAVSQHYTHVDEASKKAAIELLPDITETSAPIVGKKVDELKKT